MMKKDVIAFAVENGYDGAKKKKPWRGYEVWEPTFCGRGIHYVGLPLFILVKDEQIRMSSPEEALDRYHEMYG